MQGGGEFDGVGLESGRLTDMGECRRCASSAAGQEVDKPSRIHDAGHSFRSHATNGVYGDACASLASISRVTEIWRHNLRILRLLELG